jgi:hypothetical protein
MNEQVKLEAILALAPRSKAGEAMTHPTTAEDQARVERNEISTIEERMEAVAQKMRAQALESAKAGNKYEALKMKPNEAFCFGMELAAKECAHMITEELALAKAVAHE